MVSVEKKKALIEHLCAKAVSRGTPQRLASGQVSDVYVNCKKLSLDGEGLEILSEALLEGLDEFAGPVRQIAGVSVGGDPLVAGCLLKAWQIQPVRKLEGLLVRKEAKAHGASQGRHVEGNPPSGQVILVEDVVSTGKSSLFAAQKLREEGYNLVGLLCLVDREMGGLERLEKELGISARALVTLSELLPS